MEITLSNDALELLETIQEKSIHHNDLSEFFEEAIELLDWAIEERSRNPGTKIVSLDRNRRVQNEFIFTGSRKER